MYRLLIVDDEPHIIEGLKRMIDWEKYGIYQIETATSYHDAIAKAVEYKPHIAIFDVCIEDARGYDVIKKLSELQLPTKYIMISGYDDFEYVRQAMIAGAKDYLVKPVDRMELQHVIERIIVRDLKGNLEKPPQEDKCRDMILSCDYDSLSNLTNKVIMIVKGEYNKNINLKIVANKFKMNSTYLGQIFLKETHMKFSEYLMAYRLIMAKHMIQNSTEKISYVAHNVGYSNLNYFYSHFRDYFGFSPSELRSSRSDKSGGEGASSPSAKDSEKQGA
ncbi:MAG: response regulator [Clostridiales bacterium]|jgi:two-component system response regulator YesN|nr:response regulator [Clostridiales bacterium]